MDWMIDRNLLCRVTGIRPVVERLVTGYEVGFAVRFSTFGWKGWANDQSLEIVPRCAEIELVVAGARCKLGQWPARGRDTLTFASHEADGTLTFIQTLSAAQLQAIEDFRASSPFRLELAMHGSAFVAGGHAWRFGVHDAHFDINRDEWLAALRSSGFTDSLTIEIPVPSDATSTLAGAVAELRRAIEHRHNGHDAETVAACRLVTNALGHAGFGNRAPKEVIAFIKENAGRLSLEERYSVLQAALELFCSPAHHHPQSDDYRRADATFAVAMSAALVSLAPLRGRPAAQLDDVGEPVND